MNKKPKKSILICIPSFDTKIHLETISSIISIRDILLQNGIGISIMWLRDSLITRARNKLVKQFLDTDHTHLFFIDADISFTPDDFIRVLNLNKPISTAPYPIKKDTKIEDGDASLGWCVNFPLVNMILKIMIMDINFVIMQELVLCVFKKMSLKLY